jgi:hypothetical protein
MLFVLLFTVYLFTSLTTYQPTIILENKSTDTIAVITQEDNESTRTVIYPNKKIIVSDQNDIHIYYVLLSSSGLLKYESLIATIPAQTVRNHQKIIVYNTRIVFDDSLEMNLH